MKKLCVFLSVIFLSACLGNGKRTDDTPVAKVYDEYLYLSELEEVVPRGLSLEDSILVVKDHIDKWIRNRLLLYQAEQHLSLEDKYIERQIEDYRTSLLIFKYEQSYIAEKLDTLISDQEIKEYYTSYSSNFVLNNNLLKGFFIKLPRTAPQSWNARRWCKSSDPEDFKLLEQYCFEHATEYDYFEEDWTRFDQVLPKLPRIYMSPQNLLRGRQYYEAWDSTHYYFLKISDYELEGSITPMEIVAEDIRSILLNKRKIQLIQELEANIYNDALNRGNFAVYN